MAVRILSATADDILPLRARYREEMNCQIVHDSIHRREGWTRSHRFEVDGCSVGYGTVAVAGPWTAQPVVLEFYLLPSHRTQAFAVFAAFLDVCGTRHFEIQTNEPLLPVLAQAYGKDLVCEKIVFRDGMITAFPANGAVVRPATPREELLANQERRSGGGEWILELDGAVVGKGGILFHYNRPYVDIYMDVDASHRRRGLGSFLVQELKQECYRLGAIPAARCAPDNTASRQTLVRAGFVPVATMLLGRW